MLLFSISSSFYKLLISNLLSNSYVSLNTLPFLNLSIAFLNFPATLLVLLIKIFFSSSSLSSPFPSPVSYFSTCIIFWLNWISSLMLLPCIFKSYTLQRGGGFLLSLLFIRYNWSSNSWECSSLRPNKSLKLIRIQPRISN
jgi:hypothetical protein